MISNDPTQKTQVAGIESVSIPMTQTTYQRLERPNGNHVKTNASDPNDLV